jgi:hypothetical protein
VAGSAGAGVVSVAAGGSVAGTASSFFAQAVIANASNKALRVAFAFMSNITPGWLLNNLRTNIVNKTSCSDKETKASCNAPRDSSGFFNSMKQQEFPLTKR